MYRISIITCLVSYYALFFDITFVNNNIPEIENYRIITYHFSRYTFFIVKLILFLVRSCMLHLLRRSICFSRVTTAPA